MEFSGNDEFVKKSDISDLRTKSNIKNASEDALSGRQANSTESDNRNLLKQIFDFSDLCIFIKDKNKIIYANQASIQLLGYDKPEELYGVEIKNILPPEEFSRVAEQHKALLRGDFPSLNYKIKAKQRDGLLIDTEATVSTLDNAGKTYIIISLSRLPELITEKKSLPAAESQAANSLQKPDNAVFVADNNQNITFLNNEAQITFGYSEEKLLGQPLSILITDKHQAEYRAAIRKINSSGQPFAAVNLKLNGLKKDGGEFPSEIILTVWKTDEQLNYGCKISDISEIVQTEKTRQTGEKISRQIIEKSSLCILVLSPGGELLSMNRYGLFIMEIENFDSVAGMNWLDFWKGDDLELARNALEAARRGEKGNFTAYCPTIKGVPKWWEVTVSPVLNAENKLERIVIMSRDVTEQIMMEEIHGRRNREIKLRADINAALALKKRALPKILQTCAELLLQNLDLAFVNIWTIDSETEQLSLCADAGSYKQVGDSGIQLEIDKAEIYRIASKQQIYISDDAQKGSDIFDIEWAKREEIKAFAVYPLIVENNLIGVIAVFSRLSFTPDKLEILANSKEKITQSIEHKRAKKTLEESERRYQMLTEGILHHVWTAKPDGKVDYFNSVALKYFGRSAEQLIKEGWHSVVHPDDIQSSIEHWKKSFEAGENYEMELRLKAADGNYYWHLVLATAGRDDEGKIIKWFGTSTNIEAHKIADAALGRVRLQLEAALDAGLIATWTYEVETERVYADKNLAQLFSVSSENADGGNIEFYLKAIHPEDRERVWAEISASLAKENGSRFESEYRIVQPDNSVRWVVARARVERDATDAPIRMPGAIVDITERKQAEKTLVENEERLLQAQKMEAIGTLTGGVAHDFNNLLTGILVNAEISLRGISPEHAVYNNLVEIQETGNRAAALTRQLLAFGRRQNLERRVIDINKTIDETINLLKRIIGVNVEISAKYNAGSATVLADRAQIEQVVMNLAVNARDAMPHGGKFLIETSSIEMNGNQDALVGKYIQIEFKDNGEGIAEETRKHIFEPFFTTKEVNKGTGLGLSIVHKIINQHNGRISVDSKPGAGSTFKILLPAVEENIELPVRTQSLPSIVGGTETILFAEDEDSLRNVAVDVMELMGYTVFAAKNGKEAVRIFKENQDQIDLLIFDLIMPEMGGYEASQRIREVKKNIPLIFLTGYDSESVINRISDEESVILLKPYSIEDLRKKVRETLDKSKKSLTAPK